LREEELDQFEPAFAGGDRQRHGAEPIARQQRGVSIEQLSRQVIATAFGRREQSRISLHRHGLGFDERIVAGDVGAIGLAPRWGGENAAGQNGGAERHCSAAKKQARHRYSDPIQDGGHGRTRSAAASSAAC
jgi:hypothetical protein